VGRRPHDRHHPVTNIVGAYVAEGVVIGNGSASQEATDLLASRADRA
jgi:hypothetical protein